MRKSLFRPLFPGLLIILILAAGCVPIPVQTGSAGRAPTTAATTGASAATAIAPTTEITATVPVSSTAAVTPTSAVTPTFEVTSTVVPTATTPVTPTAEVSTAVPPIETVPAPSGGAGSPSAGRSVTLADDGTTIVLRPGDRFLLDLGEGYEWEVNIADQSVVSRVIGVLTIRGSQGLFEAHQAGTTTLTAAGNPACLSQQPPCAMPSRSFQVQIIVTPPSA
jgi:hypothetical protein